MIAGASPNNHTGRPLSSPRVAVWPTPNQAPLQPYGWRTTVAWTYWMVWRHVLGSLAADPAVRGDKAYSCCALLVHCCQLCIVNARSLYQSCDEKSQGHAAEHSGFAEPAQEPEKTPADARQNERQIAHFIACLALIARPGFHRSCGRKNSAMSLLALMLGLWVGERCSGVIVLHSARVSGH